MFKAFLFNFCALYHFNALWINKHPSLKMIRRYKNGLHCYYVRQLSPYMVFYPSLAPINNIHHHSNSYVLIFDFFTVFLIY